MIIRLSGIGEFAKTIHRKISVGYFFVYLSINTNIMALSVMKKTQDTTLLDPRAEAILKAKKLKDTTKPYSREETLENINKITRGELKPGAMPAAKVGQSKTTYKIIDRKGDTVEVAKEDFERKFKKK